MYLKSLEINGFKSFAKKAELSFSTSITSIVGPNGSGKSNVAEAFRFVLGEQSFKSMRGKKGEDLIWNGNDSAPRANRASVQITFDNSRRFLNLDFDEVTIERTVFRDGVNEYSINGSKVRLKDVLELLASAHVGASGHHIISQGEADRILNSNPRERKSMIEDALGLKVYQYKMEESERRLQKTEDNIKQVESLRREVAPHLKFLKKQVEKIEKAAEMKQQLGSLYREYLKREHVYLQAIKTQIATEKAPIDAQIVELERELKDAKAILERSKSHDAKSDHIITLETSIRSARAKKDELMRDIGRIEGELASEERALKRELELAKQAELNVPLRDVETLSLEVQEQVSLADKETDIAKLRAVLATVRSLISGFVGRHRNQASAQKTIDSEKIISELRTHKSELEKQLVVAEKDEATFLRENETLRAEIDAEKDTNRAAEKKLFEVMTAQNEMISKRNLIRAKEESHRMEEEDFKRELGEAAAMIGRDILDYEQFAVVVDGMPVPPHEIATEDRHAQHGRRRDIEKIKIRLEESGIGASADIMKEFHEVSERDVFLANELVDLEKSADSLRVLINELSEKISIEFAAGLEKINTQFEEFFALMFGGGQAKLVLVREQRRRAARDLALDLGDLRDDASSASAALSLADEEQEEPEQGIDISVNLPRKKVKGLMMLSGGERALTSIALIFAMSQVKPPPFIILDETDAALDEANSKKYGDMIENLAKYSQLILITHNRETMSRAGVLYGVTMLSGVSKLLSIKFDEAVAVAK